MKTLSFLAGALLAIVGALIWVPSWFEALVPYRYQEPTMIGLLAAATAGVAFFGLRLKGAPRYLVWAIALTMGLMLAAFPAVWVDWQETLGDHGFMMALTILMVAGGGSLILAGRTLKSH